MAAAWSSPAKVVFDVHGCTDRNPPLEIAGVREKGSWATYGLSAIRELGSVGFASRLV